MLHMLKLKSPENARLKFVLVNSVWIWNGVQVVCAVFRQVLGDNPNRDQNGLIL